MGSYATLAELRVHAVCHVARRAPSISLASLEEFLQDGV